MNLIRLPSSLNQMENSLLSTYLIRVLVRVFKTYLVIVFKTQFYLTSYSVGAFCSTAAYIIHNLIDDLADSVLRSDPLASRLPSLSYLVVFQNSGELLEQLLLFVSDNVQLEAVASLLHSGAIVDLIEMMRAVR